ncbi:MAG: sulfite oxidase-like oxidoreductase [Actinomycetota bacterium]|nr:sulfite oxidase-like oxidoreductase [Actinomycetota bacterium]
MGFYERNRQQLVELGYDPARLPPGQYLTQRFPVLHIGTVPDYADLTSWSLRVSGAVRRPLTLGWDELTSLPAVSVTVDLHCVTKWSKLDTAWHGVRVSDLLVEAGVEAGASHVLAHGEGGYTANLPLSALSGDDAIVAYRYEGEPLAPEHGYPARLLVPGLYLWKSVKWLRALELLVADVPGTWERKGYHLLGDPWREQRYDAD